MRVFVASWFFPPNSSSEGFVTYKLLRNSRHQYDVVCSTSHQWGYAANLEISEPNIKVIKVETESLATWQQQAIEIFEREHLAHPYSVLMTRSMPPEALSVGLEIKRRHPEVKWIASLADPVGNNPYSVLGIAQCQPESDGVSMFIDDLSKKSAEWRRRWERSGNLTISLEARFKMLQEESMGKADVVICPSAAQSRYMQKGCPSRRCEVVPHTFDGALYTMAEDYDTELPRDRVNLVYLGYSDHIRSLMPVVKALKVIRDDYPELADRLCFHIYGNNPYDLADYAESFQLPHNLIRVHGNCSYWQSLKVMRSADWLVHVDGFFPALSETGGSIFFAGKLADYMGTSKPILALTGKGSPADSIVSNYGGVSIEPWDSTRLLSQLKIIARGEANIVIDELYKSKYDARRVAEDFDGMLDSLSDQMAESPAEKTVIFGKSPMTDKLMTVCVPCYNGAKTLERCLDSLLGVESPSDLDVIVVDDGSKDRSAQIARGYVERYPGVVRLVRKPNGGHGSGINTGIEYAVGLYFRVLDADDWVDSESLSSELAYIRDHRQNAADVCYSEYRLVDSVTGLGSSWSQPGKVEYGRLYTFDELDVSTVYFTMAGTAFRTAVLRESGVRCQEHRFYTDSEYILKPIPFVKTAVFLKKPVYRYWRGQEGQSVSFASFVRNYEDHFATIRTLIDYYKSTKMPPAQTKYFYRLLKEHLVTHYRIMLEFDTDKQRGKRRKDEFDAYLKKSMPELLSWIRLRSVVPKRVRGLSKLSVLGSARRLVKRFVKGVLPYGVIRIWQKHKYGM